MVITKRQDVNDQYAEENLVFGEVLLVLIHLWGWEGEGGVGFCCGRLFEVEWKGKGGGRLFEAGRLLTFSGFRMGAY